MASFFNVAGRTGSPPFAASAAATAAVIIAATLHPPSASLG
ncbi:hypothetical protein [Marinimicrococcus flavescens]|uniref:Uncharacterized protein n=1 Tax=Marinimicrococcus flavescens TaxID=3031815 RepID=A0AAP4D5M8_9PROT|nr:hypothetical protein [Marinimicrococcus flavescens]